MQYPEYQKKAHGIFSCCRVMQEYLWLFEIKDLMLKDQDQREDARFPDHISADIAGMLCQWIDGAYRMS